MNQYRNLNRPGVRTSTSPNPKTVAEDIDSNIRTLRPEATPLYTLKDVFGSGKAPTNHKIQVMQSYAFDNMDYASACVLGTTVNAGYNRMAKITVDQISRPDTNGQMYYYPQDKLHIVDTGQTVEVVMTPDAAITVNGSTLTLDAGLTGNTTTRTEAGTVIVRNINPYDIRTFTTSDVVFLGRTIYESQDIEANPAQRDVLFDCNFVEHKEKVIQMTEDQHDMIVNKYKAPDFSWQQEQMLAEMKNDIEYNAFWSEREVDMTETGRPKRHMRGLKNAIKTNVAYYDPATITDYELFLSNFLFEMGFRYNNMGNKKKLGVAGGRVLFNFNIAFREYRRTTNLQSIGKEIGLNADTYVIPGGFMLTMVRSEILRQNTALENWMFVLDPSLAEWRIRKDFNSKYYQNANERDYKLMVEWQGSIAWHLEQCHSLIRTA